MKTVCVIPYDSVSASILLAVQPEGHWNALRGEISDTENADTAAVRVLQDKMALTAEKLTAVCQIHREGNDTTVYLAHCNIYTKHQRTAEIPIIVKANCNWQREPVYDYLKWLIPFTFCPERPERVTT